MPFYLIDKPVSFCRSGRFSAFGGRQKSLVFLAAGLVVFLGDAGAKQAFPKKHRQDRRVTIERTSPLLEYKEYRREDAQKPCRVIPLEFFFQIYDGKYYKNHKRYDFLDRFQLCRRIRIMADPVCRYLKTILQESNTPADGHYDP